jgi:phage head maturation protease
MARIIAQANGDFPFQFYIEKAIPAEENGELIIRGIASTTNVDHDNERMSPRALTQMASIINKESVPLRIEHQKDQQSIIGKVYKGWVDERNQLWINASLDKANPISQKLHEALKKGAKLGLSVGGRVKRASRELVESVGKTVNTFFDILLDEVSVTYRPANYDSWLFAKSYAKPGEDVSSYYKSNFFNQFLFENPTLDYIQVIEKSIPAQAWVLFDKEVVTNNMRKAEEVKPEVATSETMKEVDAVTTEAPAMEAQKDFDPAKPLAPVMEEGETTKEGETPVEEKPAEFASMKSFKSLEKMVATGFEQMFGILRKMTEPTETKPEDAMKGEFETERDPSVVKDEATELGTGTADVSEGRVSPDVVKDEAGDMGVGETEMRETKAEADAPVVAMGTGTEPFGATEKDSEYGEDYQMPKIKSALTRINALSKAMRGNTYPTRVQKSVPSIDEFVFALTDAVNAIAKRMENDGKRVLGLHQTVADMVRNDQYVQKSIKEMLTEPGAKKSVALGIPYMVTKDGRKYSLSASEIGIEKSVKQEGSFKDVYKSQYSSTAVEDSAR